MTTSVGAALWVHGEPFGYGSRTAPELIIAQAARNPGALAVRQWDQQLDYGTLAATAGQLAQVLREHGVRPGTLVGVCLRRQPSLVVGVLGVHLAGAAYTPLDPDGPAHRRAQIVADAEIDVVVVDEHTAELHEGSGRHVVRVPDPVTGELPTPPTELDYLAYVLHTSGSTGRPKGVMVSHRSLVAHVLAFGTATGVQAGTRGFGFTALGFDVSVHDIFVPLVAGGSVALVSEDDRADPGRLQRFAVEHEVNWGFVPPAVLPLLDPARLPGWRVLYTGAEAVGPEQVARWSTGGRRFVNAYGPTEATVCVTSLETSGEWDRPVPIGRPLPNHRLAVVDDTLRPVAPGQPGELLIAGVGLARGYLGDPGLTALRFIPDPAGTGERCYRTGDRVCWLPDGNLLFLGRVDRQVKVRGQRIELGEPETVLRAHPQVRHAVAEAVAGRLVAFCAVEPGSARPDPQELTAHLAQRLPSAMVPSQLVLLDALPLNPSGKVDTAALLALLAGQEAAPVEEPGVDVELATLWADVLGRPVTAVQPSDDFFRLGGHSVAAMRLVAGLRDGLRRDVTVEQVFTARTLAGLAAAVAAADVLPSTGLTTGNTPTLAPAQRRLWFLEKLAPESAAYNVAFAERLTGPLDVAALRSALTAVATRHEVLRWRIPDSAGVPHPVCDPPAELPLPVVDLSGRGTELTARLAADATTVFDLATGPVWRVTLYRLGPDEHVLSFVLHHAVADGWSQTVLYRDLAAAYAGTRLEPLPATFADYAVWRSAGDHRDGERDLAWWVDHLADAPLVLDLPRDRERPVVQTYAGAATSRTLPAEVDAAVRNLAGDLGTTPSAVLLAGLGQLLRRITGGTDLVVGAIVADRRLAAAAELVGFCVDIVPVRLRVDDAAPFAAAVTATQGELLSVTSHLAAPLDRIVSALGVRRDPCRSPLVQVLFNVFNFAEPSLALPGCTAGTVRVPMPGSPFDLTVYVVERDGLFAVDAVYNPDLYHAPRMDALLADYVHLLGRLGTAAARPAGGVEVRLTSPPGLVGAEPTDNPGPAPTAAAPATRTERLIADVWCSVLGAPSVAATDNFFDRGGTSMTLVAVQARLAELLGRPLRLIDLFRYPNIRALAGFVDGESGGEPEADGLARAAQRAAARRARARRHHRDSPADRGHRGTE